MILFGESLTVVGVRVFYVYCITAKHCQCHHLADQRMLLFLIKILKHENIVLRTLASLNKRAVNLVLSKYINVSTTSIKNRMWNHLVDFH